MNLSCLLIQFWQFSIQSRAILSYKSFYQEFSYIEPATDEYVPAEQRIHTRLLLAPESACVEKHGQERSGIYHNPHFTRTDSPSNSMLLEIIESKQWNWFQYCRYVSDFPLLNVISSKINKNPSKMFAFCSLVLPILDKKFQTPKSRKNTKSKSTWQLLSSHTQCKILTYSARVCARWAWSAACRAAGSCCTKSVRTPGPINCRSLLLDIRLTVPPHGVFWIIRSPREWANVFSTLWGITHQVWLTQ